VEGNSWGGEKVRQGNKVWLSEGRSGGSGYRERKKDGGRSEEKKTVSGAPEEGFY